MAEINSIERQLIPELPRTVESEQLSIYVPIATTTNPGISKYDPLDFIVNPSGLVSLRYSERSVILNADPINEPSYIKVLPGEFELSGNDNPDYPTAEVKLRRDWTNNDVFTRPALIKVNTTDFKNTAGTIGVKWPTDAFNDLVKLGFKLDPAYFAQSQDGNKIIKTIIPRAHNQSAVEDGYGTIKLDLSVAGNGYLYYDNGYLTYNETQLKSYIRTNEGLLYIRPNYGTTEDTADSVQVDPLDANSKVAKRKLYWRDDIEIEGTNYVRHTEVPVGMAFDETTMYVRTVLQLNKIAIGLGSVENQSIIGTIAEHNAQESVHSVEFAKKLNITAFQSDVGTTYEVVENPTTVKGKVAKLETNVTNLYNELASVQYKFLGYYSNPNGDPHKEPGDEGYISNQDFLASLFDPEDADYTIHTYLILANTDTIWKIDFDLHAWYDFGVEQPALDVFNEIKASAINIGNAGGNPDPAAHLQEDSVAGFGSSPYWAAIDHVHPLRSDLFRFTDGETIRKIVITSIDEYATDFEIELSNSITDLNINIPYTRESEYVHNWNGQIVDGVGTFEPGTSENNKFMKIWSGTTEEYLAQFGGAAPSDVLVFITDDTFEYDGNLVDDATLNDALDALRLEIRNSTIAGKTYLYTPTVLAPFNWTEVNLSEYFKTVIDGTGVNLTGGNLTYKDKAIFVKNTTAQVDLFTNKSYNIIDDTAANIGVDLGNTNGKYLSYGDLIDNVYGDTIAVIKSILNTEGIYSVPNRLGENVTIDTAIPALWTRINEINNFYNDAVGDIPAIKAKVGTYPAMPTGENSAGRYLLMKSADGDVAMTAVKLASAHIDDAGGVIKTMPANFRQGTTGVLTTGKTINDIGDLLTEASKVKYLTGSTQTVNENSLMFWTGTLAEYNAIPPAELIANCLYICKEE